MYAWKILADLKKAIQMLEDTSSMSKYKEKMILNLAFYTSDFSTGVLQEFFKHGNTQLFSQGQLPHFFSLRLSNKKITAIRYECPVLNHEYTGLIPELHLIGHIVE